MKKTLVVAIALIATIFSHAQTKPSFDGEFFYTTLENGVGVEQNLKFSLSQENFEKIKNSELFKTWRQITWSNPENAKFIERNKGIDETIVYINGQISMCKFNLKYLKLKNGNSLEFIDNSKGQIYLSDEGGIRLSFPFKAQNGYGNTIIGKTIFTVDFVDGKEKTECYVYNN